MSFVQLTIQANESEQETLIALLEELKAIGFEQKQDSLIAYFNEPGFKLSQIEKIICPFSYNTQVLQDQNWNAVWESNFDPVIVDDFCAVRAHFHTPVTGVAYEIIITPKMSFGTGHHATTYMMMQQMRALDFKNKNVFDFGTGTGILSILAEKLGAASVTATDIDEWSITNAAENIEQNKCVGIHLYQSSTVPQKSFDIILANINRNIILQNLPALCHSLLSSGYLLLSGLLEEDENIIHSAAIKSGLDRCTIVKRNNWISLLYIKN